jgi:hypothetical protein
VARAAFAAGRITRAALGKPPAPVSRRLFLLFYQAEIRRQRLLKLQHAPDDER